MNFLMELFSREPAGRGLNLNLTHGQDTLQYCVITIIIQFNSIRIYLHANLTAQGQLQSEHELRYRNKGTQIVIIIIIISIIILIVKMELIIIMIIIIV
jgi:hypothetical protein